MKNQLKTSNRFIALHDSEMVDWYPAINNRVSLLLRNTCNLMEIKYPMEVTQ